MIILNNLVKRMINVLEFDNVDETIDLRQLKLALLFNGSVCVFKNEGVLRNIYGGLSDKLDFYGYGTSYLGSSGGGQTFEVPLDKCVVGWANTLRTPLLPTVVYYANLLSSMDTSLDVAIVNTRLSSIINASSDTEAKALERALEKARKGEPSLYINNNALKEYLQNGGSASIDLTGAKGDFQYIPMILQAYDNVLARVCREFGINISNVMKRAQVINAEVNGYENYTQIFLNDMLANAETFITQVNEKFNKNWRVRLNQAFMDDDDVDSDANKGTEKDTDKGTDKEGSGEE